MRVSCLMITRPERAAMMARAADAFARQSWPDRELVVVVDQGPPAARAEALAQLQALGRDDVRVIAPEGAASLGALRNLAVAEARGELVCGWDDDDLHHPDRIAGQVAALDAAGCEAAVLQEAMLYRAEARVLHWTNWAATPAGGLPGTLVCRREAMPAYPELTLGEDLAVLEALKRRGAVLAQGGAAHLYVYVTHGANSWPAAHHAMLAETLAISKGLLARREAGLRDGLAPYGLTGVPVAGPNGVAFTL